MNMFTRRPLIVHTGTLAAVVLAATLAPSAHAQWRQWGGPQRNFEVADQGLAERWPEEGPTRLWHRALGDGYSTIMAEDGRLYTMYRKDGKEYTVSLDAKTGSTLWEHGQDAEATKTMEQFGAGPHSTPLLVGQRLFSVGINGLLQCFDKNSGQVLWRHDLVKDFGMEPLGRGYSASPIAYKENIILPVGGKDGQAVMAFEQATGKVAWKNQSFQITHSSPILIEFAGRPQLVVFMAKELAGLNPDDGSLLWRHDHPTQYGANLATPVWDGKDTLVCSAAYDSGTRCIKLTTKDGKTVPQELWYTKKMKIHHGNIILENGYAYASSGDFGPAFFMCAEISTGRLNWRERGFAKSTCVYAGDKLIILDQDGHLALASISPERFEVHSRCKIAEPYAWAAPTLIGSILYVRDREHIMAFDLG